MLEDSKANEEDKAKKVEPKVVIGNKRGASEAEKRAQKGDNGRSIQLKPGYGTLWFT